MRYWNRETHASGISTCGFGCAKASDDFRLHEDQIEGIKNMAEEDDLTQQEREWGMLHDRLSEVLRQFGVEDHFGNGDYLLVDDNYGWQRHIIEVQKLHMFELPVVKIVQSLLREFPGWEVNMIVDVPGTEQSWPNMGIMIRGNSIVDDLQRQYLPKQFQDLRY
jgi:hypothetical protein